MGFNCDFSLTSGLRNIHQTFMTDQKVTTYFFAWEVILLDVHILQNIQIAIFIIYLSNN